MKYSYKYFITLYCKRLKDLNYKQLTFVKLKHKDKHKCTYSGTLGPYIRLFFHPFTYIWKYAFSSNLSSSAHSSVFSFTPIWKSVFPSFLHLHIHLLHPSRPFGHRLILISFVHCSSAHIMHMTRTSHPSSF